MPLVKRSIKPQHVCRGPLPDGVSSELECVSNNTLSAIIRQLSSLSKHAEDVFGELFNEANSFYVRANSLQDRIDRLAIKVTQLDSSVEEVSLQDINMRKAFKSSTVQDQQVVSRISVPDPIAEMYHNSEKPPPLGVLSNYRDDHIDGMKFYTDPSYFFDLWKEKMLQDTEDKRKEKRRQREHRYGEDGALQHEIKKVRKAHNRRQEWDLMAFDKELRPEHQNANNIRQGTLSESSSSPEARTCCPEISFHAHAFHNHSSSTEGADHEYQSIGGPLGEADGISVRYRSTPSSYPHLTSEGEINGDITLPPADYGMMEYYATSGAPIISTSQTAFASHSTISASLPPHPLHTSSALSPPSPYVPSTGTVLTLPSPGPSPPPIPPVPLHLIGTREEQRRFSDSQSVTDGRSDLLSAIRMGIQLKKVQEQQEQRAKKERMGNDVASILSRRIAVEYSDSDEESELDENEWSD